MSAAARKPRLIVLLYSASVLVFGLVSLLAVAVTRVAAVTGAPLVDSTWDQLIGLHLVLRDGFVVLPLALALLAYLRLRSEGTALAFPRLALLAWALHVVGGLLVMAAALVHGIEPEWPYAVASVLTAGTVSGGFLLGLALAAISWLLTAVVLLSTLRFDERAGAGVRAWTTTLGCWLLIGSTPVLLAAIALAFVDLRLGWHVFALERAGDPLFVTRLVAWTETPLHVAVWLQIIGVAADVVDVDRRLPEMATRLLRWVAGLAAVLSLCAIDLRGLWPVVALWHAWAGLFFKALVTTMLVVALSLVARPLLPALRERSLASVYLTGALLHLLLFASLDFFLSTPAAAVYVRGGLDQLAGYLLATSAVLTGFACWHDARVTVDARDTGASLSAFFAAIVAVGLAFTLVPLGLLGVAGSLDSPVPLPLHAFGMFGGVILSIGLLLALGELIWRTPAAPSRHA